MSRRLRGGERPRAHPGMDEPRRALLAVAAAIMLLTLAVNFLPLQQMLDAGVGIEWSGGLVAFLKANTQGLVILVGFSILLEFVGLERSKYADRVKNAEVNQFMEAVLRGESGEFLLRAGLGRRLPEVAAEHLVDGIHLNRGFMRETHLSIRVSKEANTTGPAGVRFEHTTEFWWDRDSFLFCLVRTPAQLAAVATRVDSVLETRVHVSSDVQFGNLDGRDLVGELNPFSFVSPSGGLTPVRLRRIPAREAAALAASAGVATGDIRFYRASGFSAARLRISNVQRVPAVVQNTWWLADRIMEVSSVSVDLSRVSKPQAVELVMFLGSAHTSPTLNHAGAWESFDIGWILPGHGLAVAWRYDEK